MKRLLGLLAALSFSVPHAGGSQSAQVITHMQVFAATGYTYIFFANASTDAALCGSANRGFAINGSTTAGAQAVALASMAYISGKAVNVSGSGSCTLSGNWEDLFSIYL